ncbi:MAG: SusC/RagA family TonB-linked outer membrane protein [Bacteroidetes bacterium]|nr:SusC/RagA family TonB-linked outer membrane protein [Bacteroidota bacterium]
MKKVLLHALKNWGHQLFNEVAEAINLQHSKFLLKVSALAFFILVTATVRAQAENINQFVTLNETNSSIEKIIIEIRSQTGYDFLYNARLMKDTKPVTIIAKNEYFKKVLEEALKDQPITFAIIENTIILKKADKEKKNALLSLITTMTPNNNQPTPASTPSLMKDAAVNAAHVVTGKVQDTKGESLAGVSVTIKGTQIGTTTDATGSFSINITDVEVLVFSYVGYGTQEINATGKNNITVKLAEVNASLSEVVVTAFGVSKSKRGLGYSVQEVGGKDFTEGRMNNIASALSGKIAGVDAVQSNSGAGGSSRVVIRGNTSLNGNQQPLYVVDGMPIDNQNRGPVTSSTQLNVDRGDGISSINPDDIASISVLKGGAAAALYGSQAANGVVLITTKKGNIQKGIGIEFTTDMNQGTPYIFPNFQYEYGQGNDGVKPATAAAALSSGRLSYGAKMDGTSVMQFDGVARPYSPNNVKQNILNFYQPSQNILNSISLSTGTSKLLMRLSLSDLRAQDQQPNSEFFRKTINLNVRAKMGKNDFITVESSVQYNVVKGVNRPNVGYAELNAAWPVYLAANVVDVRNMRGSDPTRPGINSVTGRELEWNPVPAAVNPYYLAYQVHNQDDQQRLIGRTSVQINLLKNLFIKGTVARNSIYYTESNYVPMTSAFTPLGYYRSGKEQSDKTTFQAIINYNDRYWGDRIGLNLMAGANQEKNTYSSNTANGTQWIVPNLYSITNLVNRDLANSSSLSLAGIASDGTNSVFSEANVDYKNVFFLTMTARNDWFSVLNPGFNSILYPSIGGSFILSDVVKMPKFINYAKLRSSWAEVGSATVNAGSINQIYTISTLNAYGLPILSNPNILPNPNIRPITATTIEGGFEVRMLDSRLGVDVNYYSRSTKNDILSPPISNATGYTAGPQNMGLITNKGWEITLSGTPIRKTNFTWNIGYNFSYNESKIVELAAGIDVLTIGNAIGGPSIINAVGLPYSTIQAYVMKKDANGVQIFNKATGYQDRILQNIGVGNPPYLMGLSNTFTYKKFSITIDIDSKFGAVGYSNLMQYATRFGLTPITLPGRDNGPAGLTVTGVDQTGAAFSKQWAQVDLDTYYNNVGSAYPGQFVYSTDFVKLRRMVIRYNLPANTLKFMKVQSASIGITGLNLAILYQDKRVKDAGIDPEMQQTVGNAQGSQGVAMPTTRNIGFTLNLKF